jgi:hypothetical protein
MSDFFTHVIFYKFDNVVQIRGDGTYRVRRRQNTIFDSFVLSDNTDVYNFIFILIHVCKKRICRPILNKFTFVRFRRVLSRKAVFGVTANI